MKPLITAPQLRASLEGPQPPLVLDVRWSHAGADVVEFERGHVPGAVFVDLERDLTGPLENGGGRHPLPSHEHFEAAMRRVGVTEGRPVVVMDGATSLAASRLWWMLRDAGHRDVSVLDGGWKAWLREGGRIGTGPDEPHPSTWTTSPGAMAAATADEVRRRSATLWDVRAPERYRGESEPIDPVAGHIPGARNLPAHLLQNADGEFLPPTRIASIAADVQAGDIMHCGSGITACQVMLALESAGLQPLTLYPGSWSDWIAREFPVATGAE